MTPNTEHTASAASVEGTADASTYYPSAFAYAAAAMLMADDTDDSEVSGGIYLRKREGENWSVSARISDFRVDDGDTLFDRFDINARDPLVAHANFALRTKDERPARFDWAETKKVQLHALLVQLHAGEHPLLRWVAAVVDVLPEEHLDDHLNFRVSRVSEVVELNAGRVRVVVSRVPGGTAWRLEVTQKVPPFTQWVKEVEVGAREDVALEALLAEAWIHRRQPA